MKRIDLKLTVAELVKAYPELIDILAELGLEKILNPAALKAMGNIMTLPRGAAVRNIPMEKVIALLAAHGFETVGNDINEVCQLKTARIETAAGMVLEEGHPIALMRAENDGMEKIRTVIEGQCVGATIDTAVVIEAMTALNAIRNHYAKKEELLMPLLYNYGVTGPSQVMWNEDDEIKKELGTLTRAIKEDADNVLLYKGRIAALMKRVQGMAAKEERILFPLCLNYFTTEEWMRIYRDFPDMGIVFVEEPPVWDAGAAWADSELQKTIEQEILAGKVQLPTGELTVKQLRAMFSLLPVDITFIDEQDRLRFFINEGNVFPRPKAALGRLVFECHPPQIVPVVKNLLADFRAKKREALVVARYIMGKPILVKYMAVYGEEGNYLGTVEVVQDCSEVLAKFPQRK